MDRQDILRIFEETAYVRTGGSPEELRAAEYIARECKRFGGEAVIEPFPVDMATIEEAVFLADGQEIPCKGYLCAGSSQVEAPLYYLRDTPPRAFPAAGERLCWWTATWGTGCIRTFWKTGLWAL